MSRAKSVLLIGGVILISVVTFRLLYLFPWTGFGAYVVPNASSGDYHRGKTLWDWLSLLIIPLVLLIGGYFLNRSERKQDRDIADQRTMELALETYLKEMSNILLHENLKPTKENESNDVAQDVARTWTLTALRRVDAPRKQTIVQFLIEAELVGSPRGSNEEESAISPIISLSGADLSGAILNDANLSGANLSGANLGENDLSNIHLSNADLNGANLFGAGLLNADLSGAVLSDAVLIRAALYGAALYGADLSNAILSDADLFDTPAINADLSRVHLEGAKCNNETIWPDGFDYRAAGVINVDDQPEN